MADIDVDQWRNAQALLLRSAKACRRIVVIHEAGRVLKLRHTDGLPLRRAVTLVDDPHRLAKDLYEAHADVTDFAVVLERDAVDTYFAQVQDGWDIDDDLDEFVRKTYAALDSYPDGIVTYPGPARTTLGLQWRVDFDDVRAAVDAAVAPRSTVVLGVESGGELWASLLLDFDDDHRVTSITTADPSLVETRGTPAGLVAALTAWAERADKTVSVGLVLSRDAAEDLLAAPSSHKAAMLANLLNNGSAVLHRHSHQ